MPEVINHLLLGLVFFLRKPAYGSLANYLALMAREVL
jgi:hypothetical protein